LRLVQALMAAEAVAMQRAVAVEVAQPGLAAEAADLQASQPGPAGPARLAVAKPGSAGAGPARPRHAMRLL
jgi:hypothetical protein